MKRFIYLGLAINLGLAIFSTVSAEELESLRFLPPGTELAIFFDSGVIEEAKQRRAWDPVELLRYQQFSGARGVVKGERTPANSMLFATNILISTRGAVALSYFYTNTAAYSYVFGFCEDVNGPNCGDSDYNSFGFFVDSPGHPYFETDDIAESYRHGGAGYGTYFDAPDNTMPACQWNRVVVQWDNVNTNSELWINGQKQSLTAHTFTGVGPSNHYDYVVTCLGLLGSYSLGTGPTVTNYSQDGMLGYLVLRNGAWWTPTEIKRMTVDGLE